MDILGITFGSTLVVGTIIKDDSFKGALIAIGAGCLIGTTISYIRNVTPYITIGSNGISIGTTPGFRLY